MRGQDFETIRAGCISLFPFWNGSCSLFLFGFDVSRDVLRVGSVVQFILIEFSVLVLDCVF